MMTWWRENTPPLRQSLWLTMKMDKKLLAHSAIAASLECCWICRRTTLLISPMLLTATQGTCSVPSTPMNCHWSNWVVTWSRPEMAVWSWIKMMTSAISIATRMLTLLGCMAMRSLLIRHVRRAGLGSSSPLQIVQCYGSPNCNRRPH